MYSNRCILWILLCRILALSSHTVRPYNLFKLMYIVPYPHTPSVRCHNHDILHFLHFMMFSTIQYKPYKGTPWGSWIWDDFKFKRCRQELSLICQVSSRYDYIQSSRLIFKLKACDTPVCIMTIYDSLATFSPNCNAVDGWMDGLALPPPYKPLWTPYLFHHIAMQWMDGWMD